MLKIRLQRVGRKNDPSFRLVVTESTNAAKKSGRFAEVLGSYDARHGEPTFKQDRILHWIKMGAQLSDTAHNLLVRNKIIEGKTRNPLPKKTVIKKAEPEVKEEVKAEEPKAEVQEETTEEVKEEAAEEVKEEAVEAPVA